MAYGAIAALAVVACSSDDSAGPGDFVESGGGAGMDNLPTAAGGAGNSMGGAGSSIGGAGMARQPDGGSSSRDGGARESGADAEGGIVVVDPGTMGDGNFTIAAPFHNAPELTVKQGAPQGKIVRFTMDSSQSKIFTGAGHGGTFTRNVAVYLPPGYASGTEVPFMVVQDGVRDGYINQMVPLMDNLIPAAMLPSMAGVFADPGNVGDERSFEYDTVSEDYLHFVETELLPTAKAQVKMQATIDLNLTQNPEGRGSMGGSSGGSCAFVMGWFHPELYRRLLTISGTFRPNRPTPEYPTGAAIFYEQLIPSSPPKPLRVFLEVGDADLAGWKEINDSMAAALAAKGYHYRYIFAKGAGHIDVNARSQYLPETMLWLWRGYR
jgi:enterochelin esterase family protein